MRFVIAVGLFLLQFRAVFAVDVDETLRLNLVKSDVVVLGEFASEPARESMRSIYKAKFKVAQILKWEAPIETQVGDAIEVEIRRFEFDDEAPLPELKKGANCILFLDCEAIKPQPLYRTSDYWFAVQRPSRKMVKTLEDIVGEQKFNPLRIPTEKEIDRIHLDPAPPVGLPSPLSFGEFRIKKEDVLEMLRDYRAVSRWKWKHEYCHVGLQDRTGTIVLNTTVKIQYMMRPGGLATLTFPDRRMLYLAHVECSK